MTVSLKHIFQSAKTDSTDTTLIQPSNWNEEHELTLATNKVLGRATAGTGAAEELSVGTALSVTGGTLAVTTVPAANGGTGLTSPGTSGNVLTSDGTGWTSATPASPPVNYPQNIQSANYTLVLGDAGKQIFHPVSDTTFRTYTIPANASVAFPIGTVVLFTVENNATFVNVAITSDTLVLGNGTTGTVLVAPNNTLMCIKVTATKWMANFLYQANITSTISLAVGHETAPYISVYPFNVSTGYGVKYADPATALPGQGNSVAFTEAGNAVAVAHNTTPNVTTYRWSAAGFGSKYTNPGTLPPSNASGVAFTYAGDAIAVSGNSTPYVRAYPFNVTTGYGTIYANPATLPAGAGQSVAFPPAGNAVAIAHATTPFVSAYPFNVSTGFGTKYTNPATLPTGQGNGVTFSPAGDAIAIAHTTTPFVSVYPWTVGSGFGTKYADPATLPTGNGQSVAFSPLGDAIAVGHTGTPFMSVYPWSGSGFGIKYTNPASIPGSEGYDVAFSPTGDAIAVATYVSSPYFDAYPWNSSTGFGTKYAAPATLPTGFGFSVAFTLNS